MGARRFLAALIAPVAALGACATPPAQAPSVAVRAVDPSFVHGTDGGETDRLAATVVTDVQEYWKAQYPATFGGPWRPVDGGFFSVDTANTSAAAPPCSGDAADVEGNAYYCATVDAVAWDRTALLPVLREHYGEAAVVVVLAHELGHAVQQRSGAGTDDPRRTEAMADCYAGSFVRWAADGRAPHLRVRPDQLDGAMRALTVFRDPVGGGQAADPHGSAFDRVAAFQDGYRGGPGRCAQPSPALPAKAPEEPNRPVPEVLAAPDVRDYFTGLVSRRGARWSAPPVVDDPGSRCGETAVEYCTDPARVAVDEPALAALDHDIGDQAITTLVASRYAVAALDALGLPAHGVEGGRRVSCLAGAYTGRAALSPGDLDEAVEVLLAGNGVSRDVDGVNALTGFDRFLSFRGGALGGPGACGLR
ncbi:peptidase [Saccharopolyspora erythraea]|uniref:peptidase n=1 Tax=Saccharopolyspora erythraea TaxID=1836 RepID=UPI0001D30EF5|nr:peptidase [Saccharopolyspora erythraea]EQD84435.1 peptidase [Saccharopolyspora erythraea D]QRK88999.1 peptidase [Saccharopolyspora erythraea]